MAVVVLAGASGHLGRHVMTRLLDAGHQVRAITRDSRRVAAGPGVDVRRADVVVAETLRGICDGADAVVSCVGASVDPMRLDLSDPRAVDVRGNKNLLAEAESAGVQRFVYVSVFGGQDMRHLRYCDVHERVVDALDDASVEAVIVRPTGFYSALVGLVDMARWGFGMVIGDGSALTNPVHEADLAGFVVDGLEGEPRDIDVGGPEVLSRARINELAFEALGKHPRVWRIPPFFPAMGAFFLGPIDPRMSTMIPFFSEVMRHDCVAPQVGTQTLGDYFARYVEHARP